ncbi:MAG: hypothetical protein KBH81_08470 [Phycisphaerae bacterium]|nr:hypothetical protein [Phycisphaerae bacterium]HOO16975.1 hypothetical protein [Phycisphaerae bacterium]HPC21051.1 hypothetical protein [Phycisphaerae bacterium]HRS28877.1 hypothetical protein [Phycisphaerae bacterium]HRT41175.1 hypothetical protein [Phycisphaerae bacterium]
MSIGVIIAGFAAAAALVLWYWVAATKQVSAELLKEYQRLLREAREEEAHSDENGVASPPAAPGDSPSEARPSTSPPKSAPQS